MDTIAVLPKAESTPYSIREYMEGRELMETARAGLSPAELAEFRRFYRAAMLFYAGSKQAYAPYASTNQYFGKVEQYVDFMNPGNMFFRER